MAEKLTDKKFLLLLLAVIIIITGAIIAFNYSKTKKEPVSPPQQTQALRMIFSCPGDKSSCTPTQFQNNGHPALGFDLSFQSQVKRIISALATKSSEQTLYESFIFGADCFVLTYTFPADAELTASSSSLLRLDPVAQLGQEGLSAEGQRVNLIVELQKRSLENITTTSNVPKPEQVTECSDINKDAKDFGDYQSIDPGLFE